MTKVSEVLQDHFAGGGGSGGTVTAGVASFNGRSGNVLARAGDYTAAMVGLDQVDNTSDANKPISNATQAALDLKADDAVMRAELATKADAGAMTTELAGKADVSSLATVATTGDYSDLNNAPAPYSLPMASATALGGVIVGSGLVISPTGVLSATGGGGGVAGVEAFNGRTGTVSPQAGDYTAAMVGLDKVDNTSDAEKPISTATQAALDLKANAADVNAALADKANESDVAAALALKAGVQYVDDGLALKADAASTTTALASKADTASLAAVATSGDYTDLTNTPAPYSLPTASDTVLGGIKVGNGLAIDSNGFLNATGGSGTAGVTSFAGRTGDVTPQAGDYTAAMVGLDNVDNTSDANKPISTATQAALDGKADAATVAADMALKANTADLATVATTGLYSDLTGTPTPYSLPTASGSELGGIKIGTGLSIDAQGVVTVVMSSVIDSGLDVNSQNAVQNAVVTAALDTVTTSNATNSAAISALETRVVELEGRTLPSTATDGQIMRYLNGKWSPVTFGVVSSGNPRAGLMIDNYDAPRNGNFNFGINNPGGVVGGPYLKQSFSLAGQNKIKELATAAPLTGLDTSQGGAVTAADSVVQAVGKLAYALSTSAPPRNYSTTEQVVGTWIDGKPVYQKTIVHTATATQALTARAWTTLAITGVPLPSEIDTLVESSLINRQVSENPVANAALNIVYYIAPAGGLYYYSEVPYAWTQLILTLRYTKSAD